MTAQATHVPNINGEVVAWLPLDVQRTVHGIGQFVVPRVSSHIKRRQPTVQVGADVPLGVRHGRGTKREGRVRWNGTRRIPRGGNGRSSPWVGELIAVWSLGKLSWVTKIKGTGEHSRAELGTNKG